MNVAATIDKQISDYLLMLNTVQKKAVLGFMKSFAKESENGFDAEMNRRFAAYENGTESGYTLAETEDRARKAF